MTQSGLISRVWSRLTGRRAVASSPFDPAWVTLFARGGQRSQLDVVREEDGQIYLHGWLIVPAEERAAPLRMWWNDQELTPAPLPRPDVEEAYAWAAAGGFAVLGIQLKTGGVQVLPWNRIRFTNPNPVGADWWYSTADAGLPLPEDARRVRVHGSDDPAAYRVTGSMAIGQLRAGYEKVTGRKWDEIGRLLDWGCGSGRTTRFLQGSPVQVTGVDVDADNAGWCRTNLPFGRFEHIPLLPPTRLPADTFDAAIGVSIFTHLAEDVQFAWLAELARVLKPGGHALMTKHGTGAMAFSKVSAAEQKRLADHGFCDRPNPVLTGHIDDATYYRDTFHTDEYIRREWGKHFEVRDILTAHVGLQDLVVLRKR